MEIPNRNDSVAPFGLQLLDIAALQEIYGRNYDVRTADTTYSAATAFSSTRPHDAFIYTIWDGGGSDTIDASAYTNNLGAVIDLRQGEFSSIGYNAEGGNAQDNVAIAFHAIIEKATGTSNGDILIGNAWNNTINGGGGNDRIFGDGVVVSQDSLVSQIKSSSVGFGTGAQHESGSGIAADINGSGDDILRGGAGNDIIYGGAGDDSLWGEGDNDTLHGGDGRDDLVGGAGVDTISGGAGGDYIGGQGTGAGLEGDAYDGGTDAHETYQTFDTLDYSDAAVGVGEGVRVNLNAGTARGLHANGNAFGATDMITNVEKVIGTNYADDLQGSNRDEWLEGGAGNDTLRSGGGNDVLRGGSGADIYELVKADGEVAHIVDGEGANTIVMQGFDPSQVTLTRNGNDLQVRNGGVVVAVAYGQFGADGGPEPAGKIGAVKFKVGNAIDENQTRNIADADAGDFVAGTAAAKPAHIPAAQALVNTGQTQSSPLVLDLNASGTIDLISFANSNTRWDIDQDGFAERTGWVAPTDGLLALDVNGNGSIDDNGELFGTMDIDGFTILSQHDSNSDGKITATDAVWDGLLVWRDINSNGYSESNELQSLSAYNIVSVNLFSNAVSQSNQGNFVSHTGTYTVDTGSGLVNRAVHDVWFTYDNADSQFVGDYTLDARAIFLPDLRGTGGVADLRVAMSMDNDGAGNLLDLVDQFSQKDFLSIFEGTNDVLDEVRAIMFRWTGVDDTDPQSRGIYVDAQELECVENLLGTSFLQRDIYTTPYYYASQFVEQAFILLQNNIYARLLAQGAGGELFTGNWKHDVASSTFTGITGLNAAKLAELQTEATGLADTEARGIFWANVVRMVEFTVGTANLNATHRNALANAISGSDPTLDLAEVVASLSGAGIVGVNIQGTSGNDTISGSAGDDILDGFAGNDTINGLDGRDRLNGRDGNDTLNGGVEDDLLSGGTGNDRYIYNLGDGNDVIVDEGTGVGNDNDRIVFGNGITLANLTFTRFGSTDLNIQIDVGGQISSINIERQFNAGGGAIERIEFFDSSIHELEIQELQVHGLETGDVLYGVVTGASQNDMIFGHGGNDTIYAYGGDDTISGGAGSDTVQGGDGIDTAVWETDGTNFIIYRDNANYIVVQDTGDTSPAGFGTDKIYNDVEFIVFNDITIDLSTTTFGLNDIAWGTPASISGTTANDILNGYLAHDTIHGLAGNDTISGHKGNDNIFGEAGNDSLYGGEGNDSLSGGDQNDTLYDDAGNDTFDGGSGIDTLNYGSATAGVTVDLSITAAQDTGGAGIDTISGVENLTGSVFNDILTGDANANLIVSGAGDDVVDGGAGNDTIQGGAGNDTISGGDGTDLLTYASIAGGVSVDLSLLSSQNTGGAGADTLSGFESLTGSGFADVLRGDDNGNTIDGGAGDDIIEGRSGSDILIGGNGVDTLTYANSVAGVAANLALTTAQNTVGAGTDTVSGFENLTGSAFNDTLTGNSANNVIEGGEGNDILNGASGTDTLSYATASTGVTVSLAITSAQDTGGAGIDTVSNFENLVGSVFDDVLIGSAGVNSIDGGAGNDVLQGGLGSDIALIGGSGIDTASWNVNSTNFIIYRDNADYITVRDTGASGYGLDRVYNDVEFISFNDVTLDLATTTFILNGVGWGTSTNLVGTSGNNTLNGTAARDIIFGGSGNDTLIGNQGDDDLYGDSGLDTVSYAGALSGVTVNLSITSAQNTVSAGMDMLAGFENLTGSNFNDTLTGDDNGNVINGGSGNDVIVGGAGNDTLIGGADTDTLSYSSAASAVNINLALTTAQDTGGAGIDTVSGFENLTGSSFNDTLTASSAANRIDGGAGSDTIIGGAGNDTIIGGDGDDIMTGEAGTDTLNYVSATAGVIVDLSITTAQDTSGAGIDTASGFENLVGSAFNDVLSGDIAGNIIDGGTGDDIIEGRSGNDTLIGGTGADTLSYTNATAAVTVNLALVTAQNTGGGGTDTISGFENLTGSSFNDVLIGNASVNIIDGGAGIDTVNYAAAASGTIADLSGGLADDVLLNIENVIGSAFGDTITGDGGANIFKLGAGNDVADGGGGVDTVDYSAVAAAMNVNLVTGIATGEGSDTLSNIENVITAGGYDIIRGNNNANALSGGAGNDTLSGGGGLDTLDGGAGTDIVDYSAAAAGVVVNLLTGSASNDGDGSSDVLLNIENVIGSSFNDNIAGNSSVNVLSGGAGDDLIAGGLANDTMDGGAGIDTVDYSSSTSAVTVNLNAGTGTGQGTDTLSNFENVIGSAFNDTITGTSGGNILNAGAGNDLLKGSTGNDILDGGSGIDTVEFTITSSVTVNLNMGTALGEGADTLANIENVTTDGGNDTLIGDSSNNVLNSGTGDDLLAGGSGNDTLNGAAGIDTVTYAGALAGVTANLTTGLVSDDGDGGTDTLLNIENIYGSGFNDTITGSGSANVIDGGAGNDVISAGGGNDTISAGAGNDTIDGEAGTDTVSYFGAANGVTIDLSTGVVSNDGDGGTDTLLNIENVTGSAYNDTITGSSVVNVLDGGAGNDMIAGGSGNDTLTGGEGDDTIEGGTGSDTLSGGNGIDTLTYVNATVGIAINLALTSGQSNGAIGADTVSGFENLVGSAFNDTLTGNTAANVIEGGAGNDVMNGNAGTDTLSYTSATAGVTINLSLTSAQNTGGAGTDTISNFENLTGSAFDDALRGDTNGNIIDGGAGNDTYFYHAGDGSDVIKDSDGIDIIRLGVGISEEDLAFTQDRNNLIIAVNGSSAITVTNHFVIEGDFAVESLILDDDTVIDLTNLSSDDTIYGTEEDDVLAGTAGDDIIYGYGGNDTVSGGAGNDVMNGGGGIDTLVYTSASTGVTVNLSDTAAQSTGGAGTDTISEFENLIGSDFNDVLTGSSAGNELTGGAGSDTLMGGMGDDSYFYYIGDGSDVIEESDGADTIVMGPGIVEDDLEFSQDGDNLIITVGGISAITVTNHFASGGDFTVESLVLDDETVIDLTDISFDGIILGTSGNDSLTGTSGNDTIIGGAGNDTLQGGGGNDGYVFNAGDGQDTISDTEGSSDSIIFGAGIRADQLGFAFTGASNLEITFANSAGDKLTITNQRNEGLGQRIENLVFDSGLVLNLANINTWLIQGITLSTFHARGSDGNDVIYSGAGANILEGGEGDDVLVGDGLFSNGRPDIFIGGAGNDYLLGGGDNGDALGQDVFVYTSGIDTIDNPVQGLDVIRFENGILSTDITIVNEGEYDTRIIINEGVDEILILGQRSPAGLTIESLYFAQDDKTFHFSGGGVILGTAGNDSISRGSTSDLIDSGAGVDNINAGAGDNQIFGGAGNDTITTGDGFDNVFGGDGNDSITGASLLDILYGGRGDDTLLGQTNSDFLFGEDGNDTLNGDLGTESLDGGMGNDIINGGGGADRFVQSSGIDTYSDSGAEQDVIDFRQGISLSNLVFANEDTANTRIIINAGVDEILVTNKRSAMTSLHIEVLHFYDGSSFFWQAGTEGGTTINGDLSVGTLAATITKADFIQGNGGNDIINGLTGNDILEGNAGDDTIAGGTGNDILRGGSGNDAMTGGAGADTFVFEIATAFNNIDVVSDFSTGDNDVLDISDILDGHYTYGVDTLTDFVEITDSGSNTIVKIDTTGTGTFGAGTQVVTLLGVTGLTNEVSLETAGTLVTHI